MRKPITPEEALFRMEMICVRGEQCVGDIRKKLIRLGVTQDAIEKIVAKLIEERYVDDERFARAYVADKLRFSGWGSRKIEMQLRLKGVDKDIIKSAVENITHESSISKLEEILQSKYRTISRRNDDKAKVRAALFRFAASRGFNPGDILSVVDALLKEHGEAIDDDSFNAPDYED